uniref:FLYWCH-type domain-containing protein n=1 Tax=Meloidogyne floridensis TaxID=298350 RepID=A0A915NSP8_9BILA
MISEIESTNRSTSSPSYSPQSSNISLTNSELFNIANLNLNISEPTTSPNNRSIQMSIQTANSLLLLHLAQMQQIFQQNIENMALISQAIIAEKAAMAKELIKRGQLKLEGNVYMKQNNFKMRDKNVKACNNPLSEGNNYLKDDNSRKDFFTRCGITWKYLTSTQSIEEFDELRRRQQVSKNRHVGYGIRYTCTRNAKARDNCPYLLLHIPGNNGIQHVYSRNCHTHPIKHIRSRNRNNSANM